MYKKITLFALLTAGVCLLYSCKKDSKPKSNSTLIVGKWLVNTVHTRTYDNTGKLLNDYTTDMQGSNAWYETYNKNGSGYYTNLPPNFLDTTKFTYTISDDSLKIDLFTKFAKESILTLNSTNMVLEFTHYVAVPTTKFVDDYYYTKQ